VKGTEGLRDDRRANSYRSDTVPSGVT